MVNSHELARNSLFNLCNMLKRFHDRVRVERHTFNAFFNEELGEVGQVRRALAADSEIFSTARARTDNLTYKGAHGLVILICNMRHNTGVSVEAQGELGEVIRADGHSVKEV